ncbi:MAG: hypothetical protein CVU36_23495 [Betaproteobacteria bacterium HGW-Betaproteobacteria-9]|jgi:hypothetical protein|nr:MAG: hypothetical protein CVU36_23495 [Betaproteobacteria bacterium HGW-Betaproteobacteria-9]
MSKIQRMVTAACTGCTRPSDAAALIGASARGPQIPLGRDPIVLATTAATTGDGVSVTSAMVEELSQASSLVTAQKGIKDTGSLSDMTGGHDPSRYM